MTFLRDLLALIGIIAAFAGLWMAWPPLALVAGGAWCVTMAWLWHREERQREAEQAREHRGRLL